MTEIELELFSRTVRDQLGQLDIAMQPKAIRGGITRATKPIRQNMVRLTPVDIGYLKKAVGTRSVSKSAKSRLGLKADDVAVLIGPNRRIEGKPQGYKALWLEFGTKRVKAIGFMQVALRSGERGLERRFFEGIQRYINRVSAKSNDRR